MTRKDFIARTTAASIGAMVTSLEGLAHTFADKKIRVGIIGCGSVSNSYLPHLSKSPYVELVSACDIVFQRAKDQAARFNIPNVFPHIDQLLAGPQFDLMLTLTDMQEHGRLNKQALEAGKNVWSEKPLANSYKEGKALLDLANSKK